MSDDALGLNAPGSSDGFAGAGETALDLLASQLDYGLWVLSRRDGDRYVVLGLRDRVYGLPEAAEVAWSDTICAQLVLGNGPELAPDVARVPAYAAAPITSMAKVGAYVGRPIVLDDGTVFGTVCGIHPEPRPERQGDLELVRAMADLLGRILSAELRLDETARRAERAEHEASGDPLTGVGNRRTWDRAIAAEEARCRRYGHAAAVIAVDVDHLKLVNDMEGHAAGDALLRRCAQVLGRAARGFDVVARVGGDEFCILMPRASIDAASVAMTRIARALEAADVPASVGVGMRSATGLSAARSSADADMYRRRALRRAEALLEAVGGIDPSDGAPHPTPTPSPASTDPLHLLRYAFVGAGPEERIARMLDRVREHLSADVAFVGEFSEGRRTLRYVSAGPALRADLEGRSEPLDDTLCGRIIDGDAPEVIVDARHDPRFADVTAVRLFNIGGHVGVPLVMPNGRVYGTVCAALFRPDPSINQRDAEILRVIAGVIADEISRDEVESATRRARISAIDAVIDVGGPVLVLQPIVDLATGRHAGYEALARFPHSPWSGPSRWFAEAAEAGLDVDLELLVLRRARGLLPRIPQDCFLTVNLSPAAVCASSLQRELLGAAGPLSRLVIELTEQAEPHPHGLEDALRVIRTGGLRVAIDDAGTGYSSLSRLLELKPDFVKLDLSLVRGIAADPARQALVTSLVHFTSQLDTILIAEGVEQPDEIETVRRLGVPLAQGFGLARPGPVAEVVPRPARP